MASTKNIGCLVTRIRRKKYPKDLLICDSFPILSISLMFLGDIILTKSKVISHKPFLLPLWLIFNLPAVKYRVNNTRSEILLKA